MNSDRNIRLNLQSSSIFADFARKLQRVAAGADAVSAFVISLGVGGAIYSVGVGMGSAQVSDIISTLGPAAGKAASAAFLNPTSIELMGRGMAGDLTNTAHQLMSAGLWFAATVPAISASAIAISKSFANIENMTATVLTGEPKSQLRGATRLEYLVQDCSKAASKLTDEDRITSERKLGLR